MPAPHLHEAPQHPLDERLISITTLDELHTTLQENFTTVLRFFLEDTEQYLKEMESMLAMPGPLSRESSEQIMQRAHTIKSASIQFAAPRLSRLARELEEMLHHCLQKNEPPLHGKLATLHNAMQETFGRSRKALQVYIQSTGA